MGRRRQRGPCQLCETESDLTKEDIFPTWLRQAYIARHIPDGQRPPRRILRVCVSCNQGLARAFENVAAPILKRIMWGGPRVLDELAAHHVGRWIIKTDALLSLYRATTGSPGQRVPDAAEVAWIRRRVKEMVADADYLPPDTAVRIGWISPRATPTSQRLRTPEMNRAVGSADVQSIMQTGMLWSESMFFIGNDGSKDTYVARSRADARLSHAIPYASGTWPPDAIAPADILRMVSEGGHTATNVLRDMWVLKVPNLASFETAPDWRDSSAALNAPELQHPRVGHYLDRGTSGPPPAT